MIICATALYFHILASHGAMWEGAGAAWILAAMLDAVLIAFFIWAKYKPF